MVVMRTRFAVRFATAVTIVRSRRRGVAVVRRAVVVVIVSVGAPRSSKIVRRAGVMTRSAAAGVEVVGVATSTIVKRVTAKSVARAADGAVGATQRARVGASLTTAMT